MPYIANTDANREEMLKVIGVKNIDELWTESGVTTPRPEVNIEPGLSEYEVIEKLKKMAAKNGSDLTCFLGCGYYDHTIPAAVNSTISRTEFLTSYTPYQPEASQGTLQAIFEYQSYICRLTDMSFANASMYEGGTALFEAMMVAVRSQRKRKKIIVAGTVAPIYTRILRDYSDNIDVSIHFCKPPIAGDTRTNVQEIKDAVNKDTAAVIIQYPNIFGTVEEWSDLVAELHEQKILAIASSYPIALSKIKTPGEMGFDIVCGEAQSLGMSLFFGGPYLGYMACADKKVLRNIPGRICGKTTDVDGKDGFVLTLQAREQHIRRAKATSNICSNEGLCTIAATVYLSCLGKSGFKQLGDLCHSKANYLRDKLLELDNVLPVTQDVFFNEFVIKLPVDASIVTKKILDAGIIPGFPLGKYYPGRENELLIAVTEKCSKADISHMVETLKKVIS